MMVNYNARKFMEQAIAVMKQSVAEQRSDGKVSPKVGAVLLDINEAVPSRGRVMTACRGELRCGDHAEYTLLERKNRDRKLDGCVLFATLEPCAPNSRNHPKLGCAERIVLARIKEVWIGIADPDPTVDRKGIKYLQDNGVTVHMFDRDLQDIILKENEEFIEQAKERAALASDETSRQVTLSPLESASLGVQRNDLSKQALEEYRSAAKIAEVVDSTEFARRLLRQGLTTDNGVPTGFGTILFGKEPRTSLPQAGLLATIHLPGGEVEIKDFDGPQVLVPRDALDWLRSKLPNVIDRSEAKRRSKSDPLFELIREGVVNALVHRDYSITGAKCQLGVWPDKIEIRSPGQPVSPITLAALQSFDAPMLSRNPVLHFVFSQMELAEERGLGLKSMKGRAEEAGLPLPRYSWDYPYLTLTLFPTSGSSTATLPADVLESLGGSERAGWQWLATKGRTTSADYAKAVSVTERTARRHLKHFLELDLVRTVGSGPSTEHEVT